MSKDTFHTAFKNALIKEGWQITHDPFAIIYGNVNMSIYAEVYSLCCGLGT